MQHRTLTGVSLDADNLLYHLEGVHQNFVKRIYGDIITSKEVIDWDFYLKHYPRIIEVWTKWEEYSKGEMFEEAAYLVAELKQITNVQIVTATGSDELVKLKDKMLTEAFGEIEIIHAKDKSIYTKNTILIDHAPQNIQCHVESNRNPGLLFDYKGEFGWTKNFNEKEFKHAERVTTHEQAFLRSEELLRTFS